MRVNGNGLPWVVLCLVLVLSTVSTAFQINTANAAQITTRKLTLVAGATGDGGSKPGGNVKHQFDFTLPTGGNVGSIKFEYCMIASGVCDMPNGLVTTAATLEFENAVTGFTMVNTTNGSPYLTRTAAPITGGETPTYRLAGVTNPVDSVDPNKAMTFFVRISSYASTDTTGSPIDTGTVTASTNLGIDITGVMPESLIFCTGETISMTAGIPDCTTATDGQISFNQLFSPQDTAFATSQMAASTNAGSGYAITVNGATLTSGANTIPAITDVGGAASVKGTGQFGMNLRQNTTTLAAPFGADVADPSDGGALRAQPLNSYNLPDTFRFVSGDTVADSSNGSIGPTNAQIYTSSYIVNVAGNQLAGTYTTTLTYICTPTF